MLKAFEELTIRDSFMFDRVMEDRNVCRRFLSVLQQCDVGELTLLDAEKEFRITASGKSVRLDIYAEEGTNRIYDAEMEQQNHQSIKTKQLPKRARFYQSVIDQRVITRGSGYAELKECVIIFICTFDPFGAGKYKYTFLNRCEEDDTLYLQDGCIRIFFNTKSTDEDMPEEVKQLFEYINSGITSGEFTNIIAGMVRDIRNSERWRREYMHYFCEKQDIWDEAHEQGIEEGRAEGIKSGIEQGIEQGIIASVRMERKHHVDDATIITDLMTEYSIDEETAVMYVREKDI